MPPPSQEYRFDVAFSYAGPNRDKMSEIAELVANELGKDRVFFDQWYEDEILGSDMDTLLQQFFHEQSLLVISELSDEYAGREWCQAEARAIRALRFEIDPARDATQRLRLLSIRLGPGKVPGVFKTEGSLNRLEKTAQQCAELILKRLDRLQGRLEPSVESNPFSGRVASRNLEPRYALVIGISEYEKNQNSDARISNLQFAADDAIALGECLEKEACYKGNTKVLVNENATRRNIMQELDELRKKCDEIGKNNPDPVVLVFFSGHGAKDERDRHYLLPHDAKGDALFSTALWSNTFNDALRELKTNKIILLVDACHGGAVSSKTDKAPGAETWDPMQLVTNASGGSCPYLIASCEGSQRSHELEKQRHGAFTNCLLEILGCDLEDFPTLKDKEDIDLFDAYVALKKRVEEIVQKFVRGKIQTPFSKIIAKTNIILTINKKVVEKRFEDETVFFTAVQKELEARENDQVTRIMPILEDFVLNRKKRSSLPDNFFKYFAASATRWALTRFQGGSVAEDCDVLLRYYQQEGGNTPSRSGSQNRRPGASQTSNPSEPPNRSSLATLDQVAAPSKNQRDSIESDKTAGAPAHVPGVSVAPRSQAPATSPSTGGKQLIRLCLSKEEREHVRVPLWDLVDDDINFREFAMLLDTFLLRPGGITQPDLMDWQGQFESEDGKPENEKSEEQKKLKEKWKNLKPRIQEAMGEVAIRLSVLVKKKKEELKQQPDQLAVSGPMTGLAARNLRPSYDGNG